VVEVALCPALRAPEGAAYLTDPLALSPLALPDARRSLAVADMAELRFSRNTCVCSALASRASGGVAPCEGAVCMPRCGLGEADRLRFLVAREHQGLCPLVPKAE
jgi:hypothetical protein